MRAFGIAGRWHEGCHLGRDGREIAGGDDVVGWDSVLQALERRAGAGVADAGVAGRVVDQGLVVCAGAGQTAGAHAAVQFGEVALDHQRGGNGEERGVGGAARVELVVGDEEEDLIAGVGDVAAEG